MVPGGAQKIHGDVLPAGQTILDLSGLCYLFVNSSRAQVSNPQSSAELNDSIP